MDVASAEDLDCAGAGINGFGDPAVESGQRHIGIGSGRLIEKVKWTVADQREGKVGLGM